VPLISRIKKLESSIRKAAECRECGWPLDGRPPENLQIAVTLLKRGEVPDESNDRCRCCGRTRVLRIWLARRIVPLSESCKHMDPAEREALEARLRTIAESVTRPRDDRSDR